MMNMMNLPDDAAGGGSVPRRVTLMLLAAMLLAPVAAAGPGDLAGIRTVYLLPMERGLEQYLANQLTIQEVFQVVTDPQRADAIFTDQIGKKLERALEELYPPPPPPEEPKAVTEEEGSGEAEAERTEEPKKRVVPLSTFSRGKGNVFLVNRESRRVVWSIYEPPKSSSPEDMNRTAERIVKKLKTGLAGK